MKLPDNVLGFLSRFDAEARSFTCVNRIVLYGSYARGNWNDTSDIDIAVFIQSEDTEVLRVVYKRLSALCYDYPLDIQIQVFSDSELQCPMGIIEEIIRYGIEVTELI